MIAPELNALANYFTVTTILENGEQPVEQVLMGWSDGLKRAVTDLEAQGELSANAADQMMMGVDEWMQQPDHGAMHSYYVYKGMQWLMARENENGARITLPDEMLQAAAVLHDLMQTITPTDPHDPGRLLRNDQRKTHARMMERIVRYYGTRLHLDNQHVLELSSAIGRHDDVYKGKTYTDMNELGMLLSDADKLFGAGLSHDPTEMAAAIIERNRTGSRKNLAEGWYLLRDLTPEQRLQWRYGDRWFGDSLCAVWMDVFGLRFYTSSAEAVSGQVKREFRERAEEIYGDEYTTTMNAVRQWVDDGLPVELVGKGQVAQAPVSSWPNEIVAEAFHKTLPLPPKGRISEPRGWMVAVLVGDTKVIVDPSIARFGFDDAGTLDIEGGRERFFHALTSIFEGI